MHIAYRVVGNGPIDLVVVPGWVTHLEAHWEHPLVWRFAERLAGFAARAERKHLSATLPKTQANLSALMTSVRMIDVQGDTLILGLASDVLVSKIDKPDQIETIQKLLLDEFGVNMAVRCMVTNVKGKIPANVPQDGMVATAIQHGGEIVDM